MKNSVLITITTLKGSKQYTINQLLKKFILFFIFFIFIFIVTMFFIIGYLNKLVDEKQKLIIKKEQQIINLNKQKEIEINKLLSQKNLLNKKILDLEKNITLKQKKLDEVNDKIADIEAILKINTPKNIDINEKIKIVKLDLMDKKYILNNIPNGYPIEFKGITSKFGWRIHPILKKKEFHTGVDLRAKLNTPIYATATGLVQFARYHKTSGYGKLIILSHNFGFQSMYGHLGKIIVKEGEFVKKGQIIGYTGNSGLSDGPHLHYEIRYLGMILNPKYFFKWNIKNFNTIFKYEKKIDWKYLLKAIKWQEKLLQLQ